MHMWSGLRILRSTYSLKMRYDSAVSLKMDVRRFHHLGLQLVHLSLVWAFMRQLMIAQWQTDICSKGEVVTLCTLCVVPARVDDK